MTDCMRGRNCPTPPRSALSWQPVFEPLCSSAPVACRWGRRDTPCRPAFDPAQDSWPEITGARRSDVVKAGKNEQNDGWGGFFNLFRIRGEQMTQLTLQRIALVAAAGCFIASLFLPAIYASNSQSNAMAAFPYQGLEAFAFGWIALIFIQTPAMAWLANPFFVFALGEFWRGKYRSSMWLALACLIFGSSFFLFSMFQPMAVVFTGDGQVLYHPRPGIGFIIWMISFLVIFLMGAFLGAPRKRR
jgi:hypothetical protein